MQFSDDTQYAVNHKEQAIIDLTRYGGLELGLLGKRWKRYSGVDLNKSPDKYADYELTIPPGAEAQQQTALTVVEFGPDNALAKMGKIADEYAAAGVFEDYRQRIAANTRRRQDGDLSLFGEYLKSAGVYVCDLSTSAECWRGMSQGVLQGFVKWQLMKGYAIGSINVRLATIKRYITLSYKAGVIDTDAYAKMKLVEGFRRKDGINTDKGRETTRRGFKKAESVSISKEQADALKRQPDTAQGRRDALLMCLLLDHGLRCGEIAGLQVTAFNLKDGTFTFYRPKVDKEQTHKMTTDTTRAAAAYLTTDAPALGNLLLGSRKGGKLGGAMSERAINQRVGDLARAVGITGLSPHDLRHYWATRAANMGTDPFSLQDAGGWNSLAMPRRYVESAKIANEGVKL